MTRFFLIVVLAIMAASASGCHNDSKVVAVRGRVLVNGKPAAQAIVTFHPANGDRGAPRPSGQTDEDGYFRLTSHSEADGAAPGEYAVTVTWFRPVRERPAAGAEYVTKNFLPARYADPKTSRLTATVELGASELQPLQLDAR